MLLCFKIQRLCSEDLDDMPDQPSYKTEIQEPKEDPRKARYQKRNSTDPIVVAPNTKPAVAIESIEMGSRPVPVPAPAPVQPGIFVRLWRALFGTGDTKPKQKPKKSSNYKGKDEKNSRGKPRGGQNRGRNNNSSRNSGPKNNNQRNSNPRNNQRKANPKAGPKSDAKAAGNEQGDNSSQNSAQKGRYF